MSSKLKYPFSMPRDDRGNVAITFGLTAAIVFGSAFGALEIGHTYAYRYKMQAALDMAVISGLSKYRESNDWDAAKLHAENVFKATFPNTLTPAVNAGTNSLTPSIEQPVLQLSTAGGQLGGTARAEVSTPVIAALMGTNLGVIAANTAIPPSGKNLEVSMMIDLTGSMGGTVPAGTGSVTSCTVAPTQSKKIDYLKCAYEDFLNIVFPSGAQSSDSVRVAVAPFADYVNAGPYAAAATGQDALGATSASGAASKLYSKQQNLAKTKSGPWHGNYAGYHVELDRQPVRRHVRGLDAGGCDLRLDALHGRPRLGLGHADEEARHQLQRR